MAISVTEALQSLILSIVSTDRALIKEDALEFIDTTSRGVKGVGIFAKTDIEKGTVLLQIPYASCISIDKITANPKLSSVFVDNPGLLDYPDEVLAIGLMYAFLHPDDAECDWALHVQTMPRKFDSTLFWDEEELLEIKDCMIFHLTRMMKNQINNDYYSIHQPLSQNYEILSGISFELYTWALSVVYSRALDITKGNSSTRVIVPVLDMANHNPTRASQEATDALNYDEETDTLQLLSLEALQAGQECYIIYGKYPNSKLLYNYGFVLLNNPHKAIDLWTKPSNSTLFMAEKQQLLSSHTLTSYQYYDFTGTIREGHVAPALLATIRVIQADQNDMTDIENAFIGRMVSLRNEAASYVSLKNLLIMRLKPEQAEGDRVRLGELLLELDDGPMVGEGEEGADGEAEERREKRSRLLQALIVRVGERELLQETLQLVNGWMDELSRLQDLYVPPDAPTSTLPSPPS